jgi:hypothetical protein
VLAVFGLPDGRIRKRAAYATYKTYRILIHANSVLLVVFLRRGNRVVWPSGFTSLTWRCWLLLYSLPAWFAAFGAVAGPGGSPRT